MTVWSGRHVVLGVSGGIACYKSCYLARHLTEAGARVDVVLTRSAAEFVRPVTFEALTGRPVLVSLWDRDAALNHVRWGQQADVVIVAPATAQLIARMAQGLADDALTSLLLAATAPVLLAPAMNDEMFAHPQTQVNLALLERRGVSVVGPAIGALAEGPSGRPGRMSEPETIARARARLLRRDSRLGGEAGVVDGRSHARGDRPASSPPSLESGKMGYRAAEAAWERGRCSSFPPSHAGGAGRCIGHADRLDRGAGARCAKRCRRRRHLRDGWASRPTTSERVQPLEACADRWGPPIPVEPRRSISSARDGGDARRADSIIVGFGWETGDVLAKGRQKLERKELDSDRGERRALEPGAGMEVGYEPGGDSRADGSCTIVPMGTKRQVAEAILDAVEARLG
jgi:phosphopantothenoylcysteine decarboxylase/phosphopantothenate--cysteine ligase